MMTRHGLIAIVFSVLVGIPRVVLACPSCMGRDDQGYLLKIMLPVAVFLLLPFIVFVVLFLTIRKMNNQRESHET